MIDTNQYYIIYVSGRVPILVTLSVLVCEGAEKEKVESLGCDWPMSPILGTNVIEW